MTDRGITELVIEQAASAWLESLGWVVKHGPDIAPGELWAERSDYSQVSPGRPACVRGSHASTRSFRLRPSKTHSARSSGLKGRHWRRAQPHLSSFAH